MEIIINTSMATHRREVRNYHDIVDLFSLIEKLACEDNDWLLPPGKVLCPNCGQAYEKGGPHTCPESV